MPSTARDSSLKLLPELAVKAPLRAAQLNLTMSAYVAMLVWNYSLAPRTLQRLPDSPDFARQRVGCYLRRSAGALATRLAREAGLSLNAFVEALIAAELLSPAPDLTIKARGPKPKIQT